MLQGRLQGQRCRDCRPNGHLRRPERLRALSSRSGPQRARGKGDGPLRQVQVSARSAIDLPPMAGGERNFTPVAAGCPGFYEKT